MKSVQLVKQTTVYKDGQFAQVRWDNVKKVLMFQNRSHDIRMTTDEYMDKRQIKHCLKQV